MNGALFAAFRVINNSWSMINCGRTTHGFLRQIGMIVYLLYFTVMQIFSFFMVGSLYVSVKLFFVGVFSQIVDSTSLNVNHPEIYDFFHKDSGFCFAIVFTYSYITLLILTILVSIAVPIEKAITYFRFIASVFSVFTLTSFFGVAYFMIN